MLIVNMNHRTSIVPLAPILRSCLQVNEWQTRPWSGIVGSLWDGALLDCWTAFIDMRMAEGDVRQNSLWVLESRNPGGGRWSRTLTLRLEERTERSAVILRERKTGWLLGSWSYVVRGRGVSISPPFSRVRKVMRGFGGHSIAPKTTSANAASASP